MFVFPQMIMSLLLSLTSAKLLTPITILGEPPPAMIAALSEEVALVAMPPEIEPGNIRRMWDQVLSHVLLKHRLGRKSVCYGALGCFHVTGKLSHLRAIPDSPERLDTRFYLFTRATPFLREQRSIGGEEEDEGEMLDALSNEQLTLSSFDPGRPTKILIHGYNGRGDGANSKRIRNALLKRENCNIFSVNWVNGAKGPNYLRAVANAELVARQVSRLIVEMIAMGASPQDIHIIGFSLGAQVAGITGAAIQREGFKIGRITGLDPASFTFERAGLDVDKRLDLTDAEFVDVIHTDGSVMWSDGFGLLAPVGHVDFYPNGGQDQPGCKDSYVGALSFQLNGIFAARQNLNHSGLCSHARAVDLFIESLDPSCTFKAFPCPGLRSFGRDFMHGNCFTCDGGVCGEMGPQAPQRVGRGPLYFVTRATKPYCGQQIRASVRVSPLTRLTRGTMIMQVHHGATVTTFELSSSRLGSQTLDMIAGGQELSSIAAAKPNSISFEKTPILYAALAYRPLHGPGRMTDQQVILDRITVTTQDGQWWYYCGLNTTVNYLSGQKNKPLIVRLESSHC